MRRALLAVSALVALSALVFTTGLGRGAAPVAPPPTPRPLPSPVVAPPPVPGRNLFEYLEERAPGVVLDRPKVVRSAPPETVPPAELVAEAPAPPLRLVGFVRRAGGIKAALAVHGTVYVLAVGEQAEGYLLLEADEDLGVRVRAEDGAVVTLLPSS